MRLWNFAPKIPFVVGVVALASGHCPLSLLKAVSIALCT